MDRVDRPAYLYYFDYVAPAKREGAVGAAHASETPFVFGRFRGPASEIDPDVLRMSELIRGYWVRFATTGDPNGKGAPTWPVHRTESDRWLVLGAETRAETRVLAEKLDFLEARYRERIEAR